MIRKLAHTHVDRDLSVHPIDVGFDVRLQGMVVAVPRDTRRAVYLHSDGEPYLVEGPVGVVCAALHDAGYETQIVE